MNKLDKESVIEYFECGCFDTEHVLRAWWDDEMDQLSFEFRLCKMPLTWYDETVGAWWKVTFRNKIVRPFVVMRQYFKTIWWAIKGKPIWFAAMNSLNKREMKRLIKFTQYCLDRNNKK